MLKNVTLEMSLKPFKETHDEYITSVIRKIFTDWRILIGDAPCISVMLWTADGSEILEWKGDFDEEMEWCRYVGGANNLEDKTRNKKLDPDCIGLHSRAYYYMDNPPVFTYGLLKKIILRIKKIGSEMYPDREIRVGETFDPGPEFAVSKFKYRKHNEICLADTMGKGSFACCYATLHADNESYAGFPDGIPEGTPFGTFFGRQVQCFLDAMGFDFLWLSNGFGFCMETTSTTGALFDGKSFNVELLGSVKDKILNFWKLFREECPDYPVHTRGTNLTVGVDLATDGCPIKDIYEGNFGILPPPNSPWAALDTNFGLEIAGYLSRIAKLPGDDYMFRYYVHDPWWANTPWLHRYDSLPHDIYMPMTVCRLDNKAEPHTLTHINILTIDNTFGEMPSYVAFEPSTHIRKALRHLPDAPSPVVWVYPFDEYNTVLNREFVTEMFFADWFIAEAINHGLPIGSVISADNFVDAISSNPGAFDARVLVSIVPLAGSDYEKAIINYVKRGGKVIFYGKSKRASGDFLELAGIRLTDDEVKGECCVEVLYETDRVNHGALSQLINHRTHMCAGNICVLMMDNAVTTPFVKVNGKVAGILGQNFVWLEGTLCADYISGHLITPDDETKYYSMESLMRKALDYLGIKIRFVKEYPDSFEPMLNISRHENAFLFSVCAKDTTTAVRVKMPLGAPVFTGRETRIDKEGFGVQNFSKSEFLECRVFVEQEEGVVSCHDMTPGSFFRNRRIRITGLNNATVRFFAPDYCKENLEFIYNSDDVFAFVSEPFDGKYVTDENGTYYEAKGLTGKLIIATPFPKLYGSTKEVPGNVPSGN